MSLTTRGRAALGVVVAVLLIGSGIGAVVLLGGKAGDTQGTGSTPTTPAPTTPAPPPICPLSGVKLDTAVPARPALAVKVENLPAARPQTGLSFADIVYEEPVEAGITRFIAIYQCQDASRIEPVRSARFTDIDVLKQFGKPLFGYAGGVAEVIRAVRSAGIIDINFTTARASRAYHRDPNRAAPHNLYTSTDELYSAAKALFQPEAPNPLFTYTAKIRGLGKTATVAHVPFSSSSDVFWRWSSSKRAWLRFHGDVPHLLSNGTQVSAKDVVVQIVKTELTDVTDTNGVRSPRAITVGGGKAYVFRNGKVIVGTWVRESAGDGTKFLDRQGNEIPLAPGNTWIELLPQGKRVTYSS
jgi:hypothetical protein